MLFTAGGIATPADAAMMMQLGAEGVFVGSGIFKSGNPAQRAEAIVKATTFYDDPDVVAKVSPRSRRGHGRHQRRRDPAAAPPGRARLVGRAPIRMSPRVGVLALQGDVREHLRVLDALGASATGVRRVAELDACDGLVIPGGESTTMVKLARTFDLFEPIRQRIEEGMPVFGTCAGMILLADRIEDGTPDQETLGGLDITVRRNAFGRQVDSFEGDLDFAGLDGPGARRVHPGALGRERSVRRSRCSPGSTTAAPTGRR